MSDVNALRLVGFIYFLVWLVVTVDKEGWFQMRGVNKVILVGTLGKDPETKTFQNGGSLCNFSIATSEKWQDKQSGQWIENTEWHRITANNRLGEISQKYLKKGSKVYIEGSLRTRKWNDQNGQEKFVTEIRADQLQMLDSAPQASTV